MRSDSSVIWLVAEDCEDDFFLFQRACSGLSPVPKLQRARNGVEAQQYLAEEGPFSNREAFPMPSTVVSDLNMPLLDGLDLLAWFKGQPRLQSIPFVLLTGADDQSNKDQASRLGLREEHFLTKPGKFDDLVNVVAGISNRQHLEACCADQPEDHGPDLDRKSPIKVQF